MNGDLGEGYLSSNSLTEWPFESLTWGPTPQEVYRLFSDAFVSVRGGLDLGLAVVEDITVDDIGLQFKFSLYGDHSDRRYIGSVFVERGRQAYIVKSVSSMEGTAKFVIDGWHLTDSVNFSYDRPFRLCQTCVSETGGRVFTLSILNSVDGNFPTVTRSGISGDVKIFGGNNVSVVEHGSIENGIEISASPGAGTGVVPCDCPDDGEGGGDEEPECDNGDPEKGNVRPDPYGDVVIQSDQCVGVVPYRNIGTVMLYGRCTAPCTVDMYMDEARRLMDLSKNIAASRESIVGSVMKYRNKVCNMYEDICSRLILSGVISIPNYGEGTNDLKDTAIEGYLDRATVRVVMSNTSTVDVEASILDAMAVDLGRGVGLLFKGGFLAIPKKDKDGQFIRKMIDYEHISAPFTIPSGASADATFLFVVPILVQEHSEDMCIKCEVEVEFNPGCKKKCTMYSDGCTEEDMDEDGGGK